MTLLLDLVTLGTRLEEAGELNPEGFERSPSYLTVHLDSAGAVIGVAQADKGTFRLRPIVKRTNGGKPLLVSDKLEYVASWPKSGDPSDATRAAARYDSYLQLLGTAIDDPSTAPDRPSLEAIRTAVSNPDMLREVIQANVQEPKKGWTECANWYVDFTVEGRSVFDPTGPGARMESVVQYWTGVAQKKLAEKQATVIQCAVTGKAGIRARLMPSTTLNGAPGNPPSLVAVNMASGHRYGREQAANAGITVDTATTATRAFNWLHDRKAGDKPTHRVNLGDVTALVWTPDDVDCDLLGLFDPRADAVHLLRKSFWTSRPTLGPDSPVHVALVTLNIARVQVVAHHTTTLEQFTLRMLDWYNSMSPVRDVYDKQERNRYLRTGIRSLAEAVHGAGGPDRKAAKSGDTYYKPVGRTAAVLYRCALTGQPLPVAVRNQTIDRIATGQLRGDRRVHVTPEQAAVLYLYAYTRKEPVMSDVAATLCGRIFAQLELTQRDAVGEVNAGVSRTYGAAATTPKLVFGRLIQTRVAHMKKLSRDHKARAVRADRRMQELMCELAEAGGFPARLTPAGRADFALGYFHEKQRHFTPTTKDNESSDTDD